MPYLDFVLYLCHDVRFKYFFFHSGFTDKVVKIFVIFILFAVRQAGFFLFPSVSDSERQHFWVALCDVIRLYLLDGIEGEDSGFVLLCHVLTVECV